MVEPDINEERHQENRRRLSRLEEGQEGMSRDQASILNIVTRIDTQLKEREVERANVQRRLDEHDKALEEQAADLNQAKGAGKITALVMGALEGLHIWFGGRHG